MRFIIVCVVVGVVTTYPPCNAEPSPLLREAPCPGTAHRTGECPQDGIADGPLCLGKATGVGSGVGAERSVSWQVPRPSNLLLATLMTFTILGGRHLFRR